MPSAALLRRVVLALLATAVCVSAAPAAARPPAPGELLVGVTAPSGSGGAAAALGRPIAPGVRVARGGASTAARLRRTPGVRWVEPNRTFRAAAVPNDPLLSQQWPLAQADATGVQEAWRTSIGGAVTVAVLGADAVGTTATVVEGMRYALAHGARIINLSLTGPDRSQALEEQIQAAQAQGVLVVAAAGNQGADISAQPSYPAAYPEPNVIAVASTGPTGALSSFSDRGATAVDLAAPGEDVLAPSPGGSYTRWSGTSAAAPEVAGAAVLLEAASPGASADQVRDALLGGARRLAGLSGAVASGELDAGAAMKRLVPGAGAAPASASTHPRVRLVARRSQIRPGKTVGRLTLRWRVGGDRGAVAGYRLELRGHRPVVRSVGRRATRATSWALGLKPGSWRWRLVALDASGRPLAQLRGQARVPTRSAHRR